MDRTDVAIGLQIVMHRHGEVLGFSVIAMFRLWNR